MSRCWHERSWNGYVLLVFRGTWCGSWWFIRFHVRSCASECWIWLMNSPLANRNSLDWLYHREKASRKRVLQVNIWKIIDLNCEGRYEDMIDHGSYVYNQSWSCSVINLLPRAHVSFGQRPDQKTRGLWERDCFFMYRLW